jgi:hypothetical protein
MTDILLDVPADQPARRRSDPGGEFSGAALFERDPETYARVVEMLGQGAGLFAVSRETRTSVNTVRAVRDREREAVDSQRERMAQRARDAADLAIEGITDDLADPAVRSKVSVKDKAIVAGVMLDKAEQLSGGPQVRIEVTVHGSQQSPSAAFEAYLRSLRTIDAEVGPAMHCGVERSGEKADGEPRALAGAGGPAGGEAAGAGVDEERTGNGGQPGHTAAGQGDPGVGRVDAAGEDGSGRVGHPGVSQDEAIR